MPAPKKPTGPVAGSVAAPPPPFDHTDLVILNNALNEVCNGVDFEDDEFQTRIGYSRARAANLLARLGEMLKK